MKDIRLAINTQTPLVRFTRPVEVSPADGPISLTELTRGEDYRYTAGGVTHMLHPLLAEWKRTGQASSVVWVSLNAEDAPSLILDDIRFEFVNLPPEHKEGYAEAKEALWALLNSLPSAPGSVDDVPASAWEAFDVYHAASGEQIVRDHEAEPFDLVYVHDFQQLGVARHLPEGVPRVFHLHTPFPEGMPAEWNRWFAGQLSDYDAVIVSSDRYAEALRKAGYRGKLHRVYPFVDPRSYPQAAPREAERFRERFNIPADRRIVLNVARMDPMKGQDRILRALPALLEREPRAHVVLVGNGSFSSSKTGGLGLSKGAQWRKHLETLAAELGVTDHVTFTGHLSQMEIPAAYENAEVFCLPSVREGFGLAVVEAWLYAKPAVVSRGAGVSELVMERENGMVTATEDPQALAGALAEILEDPDWAAAMGEEGRRSSYRACLGHGLTALDRILTQTLQSAGTVRA